MRNESASAYNPEQEKPRFPGREEAMNQLQFPILNVNEKQPSSPEGTPSVIGVFDAGPFEGAFVTLTYGDKGTWIWTAGPEDGSVSDSALTWSTSGEMGFANKDEALDHVVEHLWNKLQKKPSQR